MEKVSLKFKDNRGSVENALKVLSDSITEFNQEADVCAHLRMGMLEETGQTIKHTADDTRDVVNETSTKIDGTSKLTHSWEGDVLAIKHLELMTVSRIGVSGKGNYRQTKCRCRRVPACYICREPIVHILR